MIKPQLSKFFKENLLFFVVLSPLFMLVNGILLMYLGVSLDDDSQRYLSYTAEIRERGLFFKPHDFWYIGYPLFILLMTAIHPSLEMVIIGQVLLSYVALWGIFKAGETLFAEKTTGLIAGLLFLVFVMISFWNFWILCESLLISLNSLVFSLFVFWQKRGKVKYLVFGLVVFLVAFFTKPTGISMLSAGLAVLFFQLWLHISNKKIKIAFIAMTLFGFFILLNQMLSTFGFVEDYQKGEIIYNIHKLAEQPYAKYLMIKPPGDLYIPPDYYPALVQFISLIFANPLYSLQLIMSKLFYYLLYVRPYYSLYHNALALLFLIPVYYGFLREMFSNSLPLGVVIFVGVFLGISVLSSVLLTVDWNSRFLAAALPVVFVITSRQIRNFFLKKTGIDFFQRLTYKFS